MNNARRKSIQLNNLEEAYDGLDSVVELLEEAIE